MDFEKIANYIFSPRTNVTTKCFKNKFVLSFSLINSFAIGPEIEIHSDVTLFKIHFYCGQKEVTRNENNAE